MLLCVHNAKLLHIISLKKCLPFLYSCKHSPLYKRKNIFSVVSLFESRVASFISSPETLQFLIFWKTFYTLCKPCMQIQMHDAYCLYSLMTVCHFCKLINVRRKTLNQSKSLDIKLNFLSIKVEQRFSSSPSSS